MPPKPKFTREEVVEAALELVSKRGIEALTSRELGAQLGSSARPIFTAFKNMEELQQEVRRAAMRRYEAFAAREDGDMPVFKRFGMQMVHFAVEEPKLYQMLFMAENSAARSFEETFPNLGPVAQECMEVIRQAYGLSERESWFLFKQNWIFTFGVGALCATKACSFTEREISDMLTQSFVGVMMLVKSGQMDACCAQSVPRAQKWYVRENGGQEHAEN